MLTAELYGTHEETGEKVKEGRIWWDGQQVRADPQLAAVLQEPIIIGTKTLTTKDGEAYVRALPMQYRSPYFFAKLVTNA